MLAEVGMVFGQIVGYIPQYKTIKDTKNTGGFSLFVSFVLVIANICRLFFWYGKRFEMTLVYQSIVMIIMQLALVELVVRCRRARGPAAEKAVIWDMKFSNFWAWDDFTSYVAFLVFVVMILALLSAIFISFEWFYEGLGFIALGTESMLALPQFLRNYRNKSTAGLSSFLIFSWLFGDFCKLVYFFVLSAGPVPPQFPLFALLGSALDGALVWQTLRLQKPLVISIEGLESDAVPGIRVGTPLPAIPRSQSLKLLSLPGRNTP
eukprot:tig00020563_g11351.t1